MVNYLNNIPNIDGVYKSLSTISDDNISENAIKAQAQAENTWNNIYNGIENTIEEKIDSIINTYNNTYNSVLNQVSSVMTTAGSIINETYVAIYNNIEIFINACGNMLELNIDTGKSLSETLHTVDNKLNNANNLLKRNLVVYSNYKQTVTKELLNDSKTDLINYANEKSVYKYTNNQEINSNQITFNNNISSNEISSDDSTINIEIEVINDWEK